MKKISLPSRIIIAISSLSMASTFFMPVWFIYLIAPQYPEGLTMNIWLNKLTGQVDIINGLNHYIGMKHIEVGMFPEFKFLVYIVGIFIALGLVVAISGKRKWLFGYLMLMVLGGVAAMVDFYKWGYDYGHNLDPKAAIQIPGFSYQPPLVGHKTLLNFDAYSYPDIGGWVVIIAAMICFVVWFVEWRKNRKSVKVISVVNKKMLPAAAALVIFTLASCTTGPTPFQYGKDMCDDCKMTIMDTKFGAEIITNKGRIYKFDDAHCIAGFKKKGMVKEADIAKLVFIDYEKNNNFIESSTALFVISPVLKSPMNSNAGAFANRAAAEKMAKETGGTIKTWAELDASLK